MKHKIYTVVILIALTSCMKVKKKDEGAPHPVPVANTEPQIKMQETPVFVNIRTELELDYVTEETRSLSQVRFQAPAGWPKEVIVRKKEGDKVSESGIQFNDKEEWTDFLTSEEKVSYKFFSQVGKELVELDEIDVLPSLDLNLKEDFNIFKRFQIDSKVKTIFIRNLEMDEQKTLYIEAFSGKIVIQNINSRGGLIRTFSAESRAQDDHNGRHGGQVQIEIQNGSGMLTVVMQGENGGNGSPALLPDLSRKGVQGFRGAAAEFTATSCPIGGFCFMATYQCASKPGDAGNGGEGLKGYSGKNGKLGGNTGSAWIQNNSDQLALAVQSIEGSPGFGSAGGLGGEGGEPGETADGSMNDLEIFYRNQNPKCQPHPQNGRCTGIFSAVDKPCPAGKPGQKGPTGPQGDSGNPGSPGLKQLSCLYQNGVKVKCINE